MTNREQAYEALKSLNPAPVFLQAYETKVLPENLDIYFGPPEEFFIASETQDAYTEGRLIPILDDGNFGIVTFYDPTTRSLVQKDVESPDEIRARFQHWQQYLADLMMRIGDVIENEEGLRKIATLLQFKYMEETISFLEGMANELDYEQYDKRRREFISSLAA